MKTKLTLLSTFMLSALLTACGGGSGSTNNATNNNATNNQNPNTTEKSFSEKATWTVNTSTPAVLCYDFDSKAEVSCETTTWDFKFDNAGRSPSFWTNSGNNGTGGKGGALGLFDWTDLKAYTNATIEPKSKQNITGRYIADTASGIFGDKSWYEYDSNTHQLKPNNRVYLITTDNSNASTTSSVQMPVFAVQIINYYNETATAGYPTLRWIDTALPNNVQSKTFNASSYTEWVYVNLKTGETTNKDGNWHIAFNRYNIQLNGGVSGSGKVAGFLAKTPTGYYDTNGKAIAEKFNKDNRQESLADLQNTNDYSMPRTAQQWVSDSNKSILNPAYTGTYPNPLDYGWYTYNPNGHKISAKAENDSKGALIRSAEGNSYARVRLSDVQYANNSPRATAWVFDFDIQK